jgi:hypothetical protein
MGEIYDAGAIIDKTLIAKQRVPVYREPKDHFKPFGAVEPGNSVGVVYSYLEPNPSQDRSRLWWMFWDGRYNQYYAPHDPNYYSVSALKQQGVLSEQDKLDAALPWYEQLIKKYGPWVLGAGLLYAGVRGYLSRPSNSK